MHDVIFQTFARLIKECELHMPEAVVFHTNGGIILINR